MPRSIPFDWRSALMLMPRRRFSAAELARAGVGPVPPTVATSAALNLALPVLLFVVVEGHRNPPWLTVLLALFMLMLGGALAAAWRDPGARAVRVINWVLPLLAGIGVGMLSARPGVERSGAITVLLILVMGSLALWFTVMYRHQHVELRLRELDERERAVEMARRLAAAQLEPHFLFNTLASLQHWVDSGDARAAPLLQALTGYLRATLPMFSRPVQPLADELEAVRRYLQVMQARLGARLASTIDVPPELLALPLPPGLLLTLVENAVEHGIEPQLAGGRIVLRGERTADGVRLEVRDDGPGPAPDSADGIGLANARERLRLTCGDAATLTLQAVPGGGASAVVHLPATPPAHA